MYLCMYIYIYIKSIAIIISNHIINLLSFQLKIYYNSARVWCAKQASSWDELTSQPTAK